MDVKGKKAIVFGGTSGIGLATTKRLAALGANVIAVSRNPDKVKDVPAGITLKECDVLDRDALQALFSECAPFLEMDMDG
jgi:NAD(P)-dependent dehydrogenase (short-subunit alcohol dehydrogenase family)